MLCSRCQQDNQPNAKYCQYCGTDFTREDRQNARQGGQPPYEPQQHYAQQQEQQPPQQGQPYYQQPPQQSQPYYQQPPQQSQPYYQQPQYPQQPQQPIHINVINTNTNANTNTLGGIYSTKSKGVALVLCLFLGGLGVHRFYTGKIMTGLLWMFTLGLFGVGSLVDLVMILIGAFRDSSGLPLR